MGNPAWVAGGKSPNPSGRRAIPPEIRRATDAALDAAVLPAIQHLIDVATGTTPTDTSAERQRACDSIIDRVLGKATQQVDVHGQDERSPALLALLALVAKHDDP